MDRNKINKVHNAYLCFIEIKVGNWSEKKTSLLCFVLFGNMSLVLVQFPIPVYINLSQLLQKLLIIQGHIKMRDDVL